MTTSRLLTTLCVLCTASIATSCTSPGKKTATGAAVGATAGAAVGGITGKSWKGVAVGAATGAVAGGAIGNYLDKRAKELAEVAETKKTKNGLMVNLENDLLFETNSATVSDSANDQLIKLGDILAKYPDDRIVIEGHTDNTGSETYNASLSGRRAEAVKGVLMSRGMKPGQMVIRGKGELEPVASNESNDGRTQNRRVELHIDATKSHSASAGSTPAKKSG